MLLHEFLTQAAACRPDSVALVAGSERMSCRTLDAESTRLAAGLQARGVKRGERVALFLDNGIETAVAVYAVLKAGAVFMLVNPLTKRDKLTYLLNDSRASALISHPILMPTVVEAVKANTSVRSVIVTGDHVAADDSERFLTWAQALRSGALADAGTVDLDLAAIIYTSGSTGEPKGVMLTHLNMVSAATSVSTYLGLVAGDRILCALPLAFDYGLYQLLMAVQVGACVVIEKSFAFPIKVLEVMVRERVTVFPGVPTLFSLLMKVHTLEQFDLSALRLITNTAAALSERQIRELRALFPQATLYSMYGLTECKRVTYLPPDQLDVRPTSVGRGMPNEEVWLVDEQGRRLPNGNTGELVIRGSHVMRGYWEKPAATAERLRPGPYPGEFVLHSGDLFRTDAEGYLYFVARKDDIIKSRGEKVSPREVENALHALDGVLEAAVIGVPDTVLGEAIKAFLVLRDGYTYTEREVIRHCLGHLENFMAPKYVEFVAALPHTHTGKIRKKGLA
jgi:long-chain acyl-CoA synthetase